MGIADTDRERLIRLWTQRLLQKLAEVLPTRPGEAGLRHHVEPVLDDFCQELGINPLVRVEYTLATGRADAIFNRLVVEYKSPGVLKSSLSANADAIKQLNGYLKSLAAQERRELHRLAGVVFDGRQIIFARYVNDEWSVEPPTAVSQASVERLLTWMAGLSSGIALTAEKLNQDFSIEHTQTQRVLRALFFGLNHALTGPETIVSKLFEQWRLFFSESIDYKEAFGGRKLEPLKKWVRRAGLEVRTPDEAERFFFVLHAYFALLLKLIAWLALSRHLGVKLGAPAFGTLVTADAETLHRHLRDMESGGIFRAYGITNLLEGDFFSWYLHAWNPQIEGAVRDMLKRLDEYDPSTLTLVPEETRDLFKKLYHYLLPREVRHNLGEYYTPDWLAERLLWQVDSEFHDPRQAARVPEGRMRRKLLETRYLDPACGSATFPILIIARMREVADALLVDQGELLAAILRNVVGIDLNPLAVLTARVNYLLAISDLLQYRKGEVAISVYLADSVRMPAEGEDLASAGTYKFHTAVGPLMVPTPLCTRERFDPFCELLEDSVRAGLSPEAFAHRIESSLRLAPPEWDEQMASRLSGLYVQLLDLHRRGLDGLWARLLKNNFAPLTVGQFDYVVGNPPWVNWESLPDAYRDAIKPIWQRYGLFPHGGMDTILGKSKKDISMLMTYTVADTLLGDSGRLGFVITQSVFKGAGAGQGFRRFRIPDERGAPVPLKVVHVDDMVALQPFEGASNRTAIVILDKGAPTRYPVAYTLWQKVRGTRFTYDSSLTEVSTVTRRTRLAAEPVDARDPTSPWLTARARALRAIRKVVGRSDYHAHEGVNTGGANAVYWVNAVLKRSDGLVVVQNVTEGAKVKVDEVTEAVEPDLLYPLLRGREVRRWRAAGSLFIVMVQDPAKRRGLDESELQERCPRTYAYLRGFEGVLRGRRSRGISDMLRKGAPFYTMFGVGEYTLAPWKVVWPEVSNALSAAVAHCYDDKASVPDHTVVSVGVSQEDEAHYVCAALNSSPARTLVQAYIVLHPDPHILEHVRIPRFDPADPVHRRLAELSEEAHGAASREDAKALAAIEEKVDREAAALWGLTDREMAEIKRNLREVAGEDKPVPAAAEAEE